MSKCVVCGIEGSVFRGEKRPRIYFDSVSVLEKDGITRKSVDVRVCYEHRKQFRKIADIIIDNNVRIRKEALAKGKKGTA